MDRHSRRRSALCSEFGMALILASVAAPVWADTREIHKITVAGQETIYAEYVQGGKRRTENLSHDHSRPRVTIWNPERNTTYQLDLQSHEYAEYRRGTDWILSLTLWIAHAPRIGQSGNTVDIYYETVDTGERQEFFGHVAKHLLLRERHVAQPAACEQTHEIDKDGWYIPPHQAGGPRYSYVLYAGFAGTCHDTIVKHGVPLSPGIPVRERSGEVTREILELSNDRLDKSLFEVPSGFRKVDALPGDRFVSWSDRMALEWRRLEQAFESWFE